MGWQRLRGCCFCSVQYHLGLRSSAVSSELGHGRQLTVNAQLSTESLSSPPHSLSTCVELHIAWQPGAKSQEIEASSPRKAWTQKHQSIIEPHPVGQGESQSQPKSQERRDRLHFLYREGCMNLGRRGWLENVFGDYLLQLTCWHLYAHYSSVFVHAHEYIPVSKIGFCYCCAVVSVAGSFFSNEMFQGLKCKAALLEMRVEGLEPSSSRTYRGPQVSVEHSLKTND